VQSELAVERASIGRDREGMTEEAGTLPGCEPRGNWFPGVSRSALSNSLAQSQQSPEAAECRPLNP
jgi:hypothetical protein